MLSKGVGALSCTGLTGGCPSSNNAAASTSSRLTRPREPLLRQSCKLIPSLPARRRASGVADTWLSSACERGALLRRTGASERPGDRRRQRSRFPDQKQRYDPRARCRGLFSGRHPSGQTVVTHGRGINLSHIGHTLQTDGDDGLPNRGLGAVGWRRNNGSWLSACLCRYVRRGSLRAWGCGFRRRQAGNKFVQFSIADDASAARPARRLPEASHPRGRVSDVTYRQRGLQHIDDFTGFNLTDFLPSGEIVTLLDCHRASKPSSMESPHFGISSVLISLIG
ncbi:Uncharacterised protein [Klebsiella aerogenes]|nr:Uncharacterised protein [Klebsiella aerogenes]